MEVAISSHLVRLVNCLNDNSDTALIMWVLCVISIKVSNSLFSSMFLLHPIFNKVLDLTNVHKLNVIYMSVLLSFNDHIWRDTFVAHGLGIRFVVLASRIDFVPDLRRWETVVALYVTGMHSFAFEFLLLQEMIERNVSYI